MLQFAEFDMDDEEELDDADLFADETSDGTFGTEHLPSILRLFNGLSTGDAFG